MATKPNFARLHAILAQTKLQQSNNAAYQVINQLIDSVELLADQLEQKINEVASQAPPPSNGGGGGTGPDPSNSVNNLDGTNNPGLSSQYSRGDHKHADANRPTDNEKAALVGTNGTPGASNKFVTASDPGRVGPPGNTGPQGPAGPAPTGTGYAHVTGGVLDNPATSSIPQSDVSGLTASLAGKASTTHHTTHEPGGSDAIATLDGSVVKTGTVVAARLPNVTGLQGFPGGTTTFLRADGTFGTPAAGVPGPHHTTHELGGSDVVQIAESQVTNLVSDLAGKASTTDPRFTDARTPTAHHTTHESGGADAITSLQSFVTVKGAHQSLVFQDLGGAVNGKNWRIINYQGQQTTRFEMLNDTNDAIIATPIQFDWNNFVTLSSTNITGTLKLPNSYPNIILTDTGQSANNKTFDILNTGTLFYLRALNDAGASQGEMRLSHAGTFTFTSQMQLNYSVPRFQFINTQVGHPYQTFEIANYNGRLIFQKAPDTDGSSNYLSCLEMDSAGALFELGRSEAISYWYDLPNQGFWADAGAFNLSNVISYCYMRAGKTATFNFHLGMNLPQQSNILICAIPWNAVRQTNGIAYITGPGFGWEPCLCYIVINTNQIRLLRTNGSGTGTGAIGIWPAGNYTLFLNIAVNIA